MARTKLDQKRDTPCSECFRYMAFLSYHDKKYFCDALCRNRYRYKVAREIALSNGLACRDQLVAGWNQYGSAYLDAWQKTYCPGKDLSQVELI